MDLNIQLRNNVKIFGTGTQPMLFAHGFGCNQNFWRYVAPAFEDSYKIVTFDYVGSGDSDHEAYNPERYGSLTGYVQDVIEICQIMDLKDVVFVGHSVSSIIGMMASIQNPNLFNSLICIGASPSYQNNPPQYMGGYEREELLGLLDMLEKNYLGWANYLAPVAMKNEDRPELAQELETSFNATDHLIMYQFASATFLLDFRDEILNVKKPTFLLQPADDVFVPPQVTNYLHQYLPNSSVAWMKAHGHFPHLSNPTETINLIKTYLADLQKN